MKPSIARVHVFRPAFVAQFKRSHRRALPVIRRPSNNRQPRPAVGAIDKREEIPPIFGIEKIHQAFVAGRHIRRNKNRVK